MMFLLVWYLVLCQTVLFSNDELIVRKTEYARGGEDMTLSCSGVNHGTIIWNYKQNGNMSFVEVAYNGDVSGDPDKYSVTYNGNGGVYTVTVHDVMETSDAGEYVCYLSKNYTLEKEVRFTVIVAEGPTTASITGNTTVFADGSNSQLTLTCTATATPAIKFEWRNRGDIIGDNTSTLTLSPVQASDNGAHITCTAMNSEYNDISAYHSIILTVNYACKSVMWVSDTNPSEGDDVTVVCTCDSNPAPTFTIKRPTGEKIHQSRLDIEDIVRTDTGEYVCTVGNVYGNQTKTIDILVNYAPEVKITLPVTASEGERGVQILCEADGIPNSYIFRRWKQLGPTNYIEIQKLHGSRSGNNYLLTFDKRLTYEDSGFYECNVNNGVFDRRRALDQSVMKYLKVLGVPKILKNEIATQGNIGQNVKVEVSFYSVPEFTNATWFSISDNGQENIIDVSLSIQQNVEQRTLATTYHGVTVNVNGYVATLSFENLTIDNIGTYVVVIANEKGQARYVKKLEIKKTIVNTKYYIDSSTIGVVGGSAAAVLISVGIIVVLCKRGVITKPECVCLKGNGPGDKHVYQNQAFTFLATNAASNVDEPIYHEIGPSVNPNMYYETLPVEISETNSSVCV